MGRALMGSPGAATIRPPAPSKAIGVPGAAIWKATWEPYLDGISIIYVVIEADRGGSAVLDWLGKSRIRTRARLIRLDGAKDPSALHLLDPTRFKERWQAAVANATPWIEAESADRARKATHAFASAADLLRDPKLLDRVADDANASLCG
jgi:hypothetical protein